jgi:hypothetical protein
MVSSSSTTKSRATTTTLRPVRGGCGGRAPGRQVYVLFACGWSAAHLRPLSVGLMTLQVGPLPNILVAVR